MKKIICLKLEELPKYGFQEKKDRYCYVNERKTLLLVVWKGRPTTHNRGRIICRNKYDASNEIICLFSHMYKDGVIEFKEA